MFSKNLFNSFRPIGSQLRTRSPQFIRSNRNVYSSSFTRSNNNNKNRNTLLSLSVLGLTLFTSTLLKSNLENDTKSVPEVDPTTVMVDSSVDAFPIEIKDLFTTPVQLIGTGVRTVTFMRMRVYALGLYISSDDLSLVKKIWHSKFLETIYQSEDKSKNHVDGLREALDKPEISDILVDNLLNSGVRLTARIVPVRNTDFNHLRDGLTKTVRASELYKKLIQDENGSDAKISAGLHELRDVFNSRKTTAATNSNLILETLEGGRLKISFQQYTREGGHHEPKVIGIVEEPLISKLLFSGYLNAKRPMCEAARSSAVNSLISLF